jgi:hypothetical protein
MQPYRTPMSGSLFRLRAAFPQTDDLVRLRLATIESIIRSNVFRKTQ